jgi:hypothetical protein
MYNLAFDKGEATVRHPNELPHRCVIPRWKGDGRACRKLDLDDIERNV